MCRSIWAPNGGDLISNKEILYSRLVMSSMDISIRISKWALFCLLLSQLNKIILIQWRSESPGVFLNYYNSLVWWVAKCISIGRGWFRESVLVLGSKDVQWTVSEGLVADTKIIFNPCWFPGHCPMASGIFGGAPLLYMGSVYEFKSNIDVNKRIVFGGLLWSFLYSNCNPFSPSFINLQKQKPRD